MNNVIEGLFPTTDVALIQPDWIMRLRDGAWGEQRAELAAERWEQLVTSMRRKGTLDVDNNALLEMAAASYADWRLAEAHVAQHGPIVAAPKTGVPMHNPYKTIADAAMKRCLAAERDLGIPPVERGRASKVERAKKTARAADAFLKPKASTA